jgi:hypothetical protein
MPISSGNYLLPVQVGAIDMAKKKKNENPHINLKSPY